MSMGKFKVGDRVRVVRHRAFSGNDASGASGLVGEIITLGKKHRDLESDLFEVFSVVDADPAAGWLIRSDDIEHVAESPVRTVTRREIVPGIYGAVDIATDGWLSVKFDEGDPTADTLREAAHILNQIAEALEDNEKETA